MALRFAEQSDLYRKSSLLYREKCETRVDTCAGGGAGDVTVSEGDP